MINGGFILQPRCFDDSEAAKMPPVTRELWFYILRKVNHSEAKGYKRGQGFFCLNDIQNDLSWYSGYRKNTYSKPQLTKSLRRLCEGNMVETTKATRGLIITVCNYEIYQDISNYGGNDGGHTEETRRKREGNTKNKNDKECNNETKEKKNIKKESFDFKCELLKREVTEQTASDYMLVRKQKKAANTLTAFSKLEKQVEISKQTWEDIIQICCERSWSGFKAEWLENINFQQQKKKSNFDLSGVTYEGYEE